METESQWGFTSRVEDGKGDRVIEQQQECAQRRVKEKRRKEPLLKKGLRAKLNCRLREPLSSLFPSLFYLSHVKPRLPPFTCQCIYNSELSAPGCVGGETSSSLCQHRGPDLIGPDRTGCYWTCQNRCVDLCLCMCVDLWTMTESSMCFPQRVIACSSTGLASRVAYLEGTLELCPSLHLNALIRSVCLWDLCMELLTALLIRVREIRPLEHRVHWTLHSLRCL